jgi:RHS repeat-associated protein
MQVARSSVGSSMLYQGQYFDYDSGLVYLRARYYDPYSGMFFEPDPLAYEDSVNHYAAMANNPVSCNDPSGLHAAGFTHERFYKYLSKEHGFNDDEIGLLSHVHDHLAHLGMGDLEIAAHVRVMYREWRDNKVSWEIGVRSFGDPAKIAARIARVDEFLQGKEEKVYEKSDDRAVVVFPETGERFTSDVDGLYAKRNGQIASIDELKRFQDAVNDVHKEIQGGWREITERAGQHTEQTVGGEQKVYQHGFSLNIPQEYGSAHKLSPGGTFGYKAMNGINIKMRKGIGGAFAFGFDGDEIRVQDTVDVNALLKEHEAYYNDVLFNPEAKGRGFNEDLYNQRMQQMDKDGVAHRTLFPLPFYGIFYPEEAGVH